MKNPFERQNHTLLFAAIAVTTLAAGAVAFLFLTEKGGDTRKSLKKKIKKIAKNAAADAVAKKTKVKKKAVKAAADHIAN